ncbi:MAG: polysaccharide pyruvyl transferase CsaB [Synechococcaceae cyanobacterium]|nr:polysaccharide pyruvyl transferase CsaB [Synechococcaceae cyanobacterium]
MTLEAPLPRRGSRPCRPLLCGYYGEHNIGDDALLAVLLRQLPQGTAPLVTAHDQQQVAERFGVDTCDRRSPAAVLAALRQCDALVFGGGSLLQDATSFTSLLYYCGLILAARSLGRPVLLWGQGLGPLKRRRSRLLVRAVLPFATAISWRDSASAGQARAWGVPSKLGSDPVWALQPVPWHGSGGPVVVCWRPVHQLEGPAWRPYLEALAQLATAARREVLWLPFHTGQDEGLLETLRCGQLLPEPLAALSRPISAADPQQAMQVFAAAGLVVAMRLHALILAALAGSPCAALSYDPKVAAAAEAIGCPCHDLAVAPLSELVQIWLNNLDRPLPSGPIEEQRRRAAVHQEVLDQLGTACG